jgi:hypothetical protein
LSNIGEVALSSALLFGDFTWERDFTMDEVRSLEPAVCVDSTKSSRSAVFQRMRGEIRYWLTTDRDPYCDYDSTERELGAVKTLDDAVTLCEEFVVQERHVADLQTPRAIGARPR